MNPPKILTMNRSDHMLLGAGAAGLGYLLLTRWAGAQPTPAGLGLTALVGAGVAALPDTVEPAAHPNHRAFFHSLLCNGAVALGARKLWLDQSLPPEQRIWFGSLALAFLSHAFSDATTSKGLPLV